MTSRRRVLVASGALAAAPVLLAPTAASAHSLDSSTVSVQVGEDAASATVSVAAETLDAALGADHVTAAAGEYAAAAVAYLDEHLAVTGADGTTWAKTWSDPVLEQVEGIESLSVDVVLDTTGADPSSFTLTYDAVLEADPTHEAVVVLTDAAGDISTAGVLTAADPTLAVGSATGAGAVDPGLLDVLGHGYHHVLAGADHLLFVAVLLLVAPLVAVAGRWRRRDGLLPALRQVVHVVTAFTLGHSVTLIASALGWVSLPSAPVEVLVAASVGVAAVHAIRPLARRGEVVIAGVFGLVHGLAFAGILTDLGLRGATSVPALLAFNVGVELAQLVTVALLLPSLLLAARTRWYPAVRLTGAVAALAVACGWALDRLGVLGNPLARAEEAVTGHPWWVVVGLAVVAVCCRAGGRTAPRAPASSGDHGVAGGLPRPAGKGAA
ncbi:HupE/UreJ family protein [Kineococcus sp. NUM-3379]